MKKAVLVLIMLLATVFAAGVWQDEMPLVAVGPDGKGMVTNLTIEMVAGKGRTFFSSEPLIGIDTQNSERVAVAVAESITNKTTDDKDILFTIHTNATIVDGASAGSAMALATISALNQKRFRKDVMMTGTIHEDGSIGPVGSVAAKAKAAADAGAKIFLIPRGQSVQTMNVQVGEAAKTVTVNLTKIGEKWGVDIIEVSNIKQVLPVFLGKSNGVNHEARNITLETYSPLKYLDEIGAHELARAEMLEKLANSSDENYAIAITLLDEAKTLVDKGYPYSIANNAFLSAVYFCRSGEEPTLGTDLKRLEKRLYHENSTREGSLEWLGSAQLRYLWAKNGTDVCANAEWIAAANNMLDIMPKDGTNVDSVALTERAQLYISKAEEEVAAAKAIGAETSLALRSLSFSKTAYGEGYYEGSILSSIDAIAYARSATSSGSLKMLEDQALSLVKFESIGFAEAYRRHTLYLIWQGNLKDSRQDFSDAIYLAYRAHLYLDAFIDLPSKQINYTEIINPSLQVIGFALGVSIVIATVAKLKTIESDELLKAKRKARLAALRILEKEVDAGHISESEHDHLVRRLF